MAAGVSAHINVRVERVHQLTRSSLGKTPLIVAHRDLRE
jgi:hypothetical protein